MYINLQLLNSIVTLGMKGCIWDTQDVTLSFPIPIWYYMDWENILLQWDVQYFQVGVSHNLNVLLPLLSFMAAIKLLVKYMSNTPSQEF